jgi:hypothetical protein
MKKLIVAIGVTVALIVVIAPSVLQYVAQSYLTKLQTQGVRLKVRDLTGHFLGLSASSVEGWLPVPVDGGRRAMPISLELSNVDAGVRWSLMPDLRIRANAYNGTIEVEAPLFSSTPTLSFTIKDLDISQHPQVHPAGVTSGLLRASGSTISLDPNKPTASTVRVQVDNLNLTTIPMVKQFTKIDSIRDASLSAEITTKADGSVTINPFSVTSSLGGARGRATGVLPARGRAPALNANLRFELSEDEGAQLANWLPILTNNAIDSSRRSFSLAIQAVPCSGRYTARMGDLCVRQSFTN